MIQIERGPEAPKVSHHETLASFLRLIAEGNVKSRADLSRVSGMAKSTVGGYVSTLLELGSVAEVPSDTAQRGRPSMALALGPKAPLTVVVDLTQRMFFIGTFDLGERKLWSSTRNVGLYDGVEVCVEAIATALEENADPADLSRVARVVVSVPAPVNDQGSIAGNPHLFPDWVGSRFSEALTRRLGVHLLLENDANLIALGESIQSNQTPLLYAHLSYGMGIGIVAADGTLHTGADGIAGDVGHARLPGLPARRCRCGKGSCIGPVISLRSILDDLGMEAGPGPERDEENIEQLSRHFREGRPEVRARVAEATGAVATLLAVLVDFYNPRTLVIGGELAGLDEAVLSMVRGSLYDNALPAATSRLSIHASLNSHESTFRGGARLASQSLLASQDFLDLLPTPGLNEHTPQD